MSGAVAVTDCVPAAPFRLRAWHDCATAFDAVTFWSTAAWADAPPSSVIPDASATVRSAGERSDPLNFPPVVLVPSGPTASRTADWSAL